MTSSLHCKPFKTADLHRVKLFAADVQNMNPSGDAYACAHTQKLTSDTAVGLHILLILTVFYGYLGPAEGRYY